MTGSETKKPHSPSLLSSISYFPVMCCGAAHLWTLLNAALVWPDSSLLLHFPSNLPVQPSDCHRNAVKPFYSFCMAALFPQHCQYLCISSNSPFFIILSSVCSLTGYFQLRIACQISASWAPAVISLVFVSGWWMTAQSSRVHQHLLNYFLLTEGVFATASLWYHLHESRSRLADMLVRFDHFFLFFSLISLLNCNRLLNKCLEVLAALPGRRRTKKSISYHILPAFVSALHLPLSNVSKQTPCTVF